MSYQVQDLVVISDKGKEFILSQTNYTVAKLEQLATLGPFVMLNFLLLKSNDLPKDAFVLYRDEKVFEILSLTDWKEKK